MSALYTPLDQYAVHKYPRAGKCPKSPFTNGHHRCGTIPKYSVLDGGLPGDSAQVVCLHCEKEFDEWWFVPMNQPRSLPEVTI